MGEQFRITVASKTRIVVNKTMRELLHKAAREMCASVSDYEKQVGMRNITGNAYRSFTIGIYENRKLIDIVTTEDKDPTMRTLRKGQAYPLPKYYDGDTAESNEDRYVGTSGSGSQWGPTLGKARIRSMTPNSRAKWQMLCIVPVEYATFDGLNHILSMLCVARDDIGYVIEYCALKVKVANNVKDISRYTKYT